MTSPDRSSAEHLATTLPPDLMPTQTFQPAFGHDRGATNLIEAIEGAWDGERVLHELRIESESPANAVPSDLKIEYEVGSGGLGIVDAAHQSCLGRLVAVKRVRPGLKDRKVDKHLRLEGELMGRLEHPCIPPIHLVGVDAGGWTVLVMKLIKGHSWEEQLDDPSLDQQTRSGRAYLRKHLELFYRIGEALSFAHENGIIHRDIKPDNVVVGDYGEVYLIDWGLAAEATAETPCEPGGFAGTPVYASPEMIARRPRLDARTDVYLFGATLYHVLTGRAPHQGGGLQEVLEAVLMKPTPSAVDEVPGPLMTICRTAMAPNPDDRYQSIAELLQEVRHYLDNSDTAELYAETEEAMEQLVLMQRRGVEADEFESVGQKCRYNLERVHHVWPEHEGVSENLRKCLLMMCDHAIGRRRLAAARTLLDSYQDFAGVTLDSNITSRRDRIDALAEQMVSRSDELSMNIQVSLIEQLAIEKESYDELLTAYKAVKKKSSES
jgi:tRNA A-37 threonylcarbamoyl transferase component Bud32